MTKDVIIKISGLQYDDDSNTQEPVEIMSPADYYLKNNSHYVIYDEISEEFSGITKNRIKIKDDFVEISKKGLTTVTMTFEKDKKMHTYYQTPYGSLLVAILTHNINVVEMPKELLVKIDYELEIDSQPLSDCKIQISVAPKEETSLM